MSIPVFRLFCFGLGTSALVLARQLKAEGWSVAGTCRGPEKAGALRAEGFTVHLFDGRAPMAEAARALSGATHLLISAPPDASDTKGGVDPALRHHAADIAALPSLRWLGYLSTTGVYGDRQGGWVDEADALTPSGERGRRRVMAEAGWLALERDHGLPVHLFRLAGIYGPDSNALATVRSGRAQRVDKPGQVFSRIHVEDIALTLRASIVKPNPGAAYNVCDDNPAPPAEVIRHACELLGLKPPALVPFDSAQLSPMARSFYDDNKRVRNDRIKRELGVVLKYPDYKAGLAAILACEN
jgi:nucleoside-diphosphate-sugar epimerase